MTLLSFYRDIRLVSGWILITVFLSVPVKAETPAAGTLPALTVKGEDFVDPAGHAVKFWGVNLVAAYPNHTRADALAANLAALGFNLVRPHHLLRQSLDWNPNMNSGSLAQYKTNSRDFDSIALDRFDYLNAALRRNGIYLALSTHFSRTYRPGDVDILKTDDKDRDAWVAAVNEINGWDWKKSIDPNKMLPSVDERAALLNEEFVKKLLTHVNPYTGIAYAVDPQVITFEIKNEASTEYAVICGNRFPDYWQNKLLEKWKTFATAAGIEPGDLYKPADDKTKDVRGKFLRKLDEDYFERMKAVIEGTGCKASVTYSNLWFGDNELEMEAKHAGHIENHSYMDPLVVRGMEDGFIYLSKTALAGKPFFIGEFNEAEGADNTRSQSPTRTMLPLAVSAYGSLQNWTGVVWFAWMHGDSMLADDGWSPAEGREANIGQMVTDGMMLDHMRTASIMFRRGYVEKSKSRVTLTIDEPFTAGDYNGLMRGKYSYKPGWEDIHAIRKTFGTVPQEQATAPWMTQSPSNPLVSDTGEIVKDINRRQLTVVAPKSEAFSGYLDAKPPAGLKYLGGMEGDGFATVILVANDDRELGESDSLIISRTGLDAANLEIKGPRVRLTGLKKPSGDLHWYLRLTRPRAEAALVRDFSGQEDRKLDVAPDGSVELPLVDWHECELHLKP
ncbi:MAG: hypothetical protein WCD79_17095 [Chthoniobacteraceae bacterium]